MGYHVFRLRRKSDSGSYDIYHLESQSDVIIRFTDQGTENGTVEDTLRTLESGMSSVNQSVQNLSSGKVNTVAGTSGNLAMLSGNGQMADSGKKASDFANATHTHAGSEISISDKPSKVVATDTQGKLTVVDGITLTELSYLSGLSGNVQNALNNKAPSTHNHDSDYVEKSALGVTVPTMSSGKINAQYLPSFVDDVIEGTYVNTTTFNGTDGSAVTPESGKLYVSTNTNKTYRWSGTRYVAVNEGVSLGTTSGTAFRGDYGNTAYQHALTGNTTPTKKSSSQTASGGSVINMVTAMTFNKGHISSYTVTAVTLPNSVDIRTGSSQPSGQKTGDLWFETL